MTKTGTPSDANVVDYLFEACLRPENAGRTAFIVREKHYSFADIRHRVCQVANLLRSCRIQPGQCVMISVMDGRDFPALFLGALKMGAVDDDGNYYFIGRSDDMLRVGGVWVSPIEVETVLSKHASVLECAVVGVPDDNEMIKSKAFVVLRDANSDGKAAMEQELKEFCRGHLAHIKCPRWIEIVDELPKTTTGKIQRFRLREIGANRITA